MKRMTIMALLTAALGMAGFAADPPTTQPSTRPTTAPAVDPAAASLGDALGDWITLLEKDDLKTASARWGKDEKTAADMKQWWTVLKDCHKKYDYRKWVDEARKVGGAAAFTVGGHGYGHMHVEWAKAGNGWRIAKVWICR